MPKIIAADTSTLSGSVALLDGERILLEWTVVSSQTHNRRLLKSLDEALGTLGWSHWDLDGFAVTSGPGSFTGLRIGLTTMKTLAWASGKPFVAIPSLEVLAAGLPGSSLPVCPLIDAHKREVYGCLYQPEPDGGFRSMGACRALSVGAVPELIRERTLFCGDGWLLYRETLQDLLGPLAVGAPSPFHAIRAGVLGELARRRLERGDVDDPVTCVPLYVRPSEAEMNRPDLRVTEPLLS
ncbi:MAG: tRNA (adenosine(37)-N6)-threonylcarbamoyltransferase complex dimerization subunit type 1 TsaB [Syntrophobacteraceae bacterium]|jgi:tRNA threonylcarbamoyladenosine biosynthesis protein TsaB|nr:tRNA (adenosine(37)-N6)-threonylcarbamoyltransferase complex dimerization subunit type 1 TsaB [Syntrophobacteraceae bacterium]